MTHPLDRDEVRARVQSAIAAELTHQREVLAELGEDLTLLLDPIERLLTGGKRLRAAFAYWGYRAAGHPSSDPLVRLACAMEVFQAAALIHDDVMDRSDTRRGMPSAHRAVAAHHVAQGWQGDADRFGEATATLAGDLCLQWTDELYSTNGLPTEHLARGRVAFDRMRTQLMGGQFLDLLESVRGWEDLSTTQRLAGARRVIRYKSAKYTIEEPLLIGATAGGLDGDAVEGLSAYGLALGEAFQLRDDLLGVYGDPEQTGKPAGDDLREGKRTVLLAHALDRADESGRSVLADVVGTDLTATQVEQVREVLLTCGAVAAVEDDIAALAGSAHAALDRVRAGLDPEAAAVLADLVEVCTARES